MTYTLFKLPKLITCGFKNEEREVYKASNVAVQDSSKPRIFLKKGRERKVIKKVYKNRGRGGVTQLLTDKNKTTIFQRQTNTYPITKNLF